MREEDSNWFSRWEEELPSPEELMPLSQTLITPDLAIAFDITTNNNNTNPITQQQQQSLHLQQQQQNLHLQQQQQLPTTPSNPTTQNQQQPSSADFDDSGELGSGNGGDEPARTLKRPRLVWTPQLHKRFVDAVAHLGIKNAVPKTIMQLMSVDGLTRENVASHLQKYRLYLKRMQGLSGGGGGSGGCGGGVDAATDHLFASSPVPPHFLQPGRTNSDHFMPFVQVPALQHHHQMAAAAAAAAVQQPQYHRQVGHFGSPPNGNIEHPFLSRQSQQQLHRMGAPVHSPVAGYVEDMESANASGGRKLSGNGLLLNVIQIHGRSVSAWEVFCWRSWPRVFLPGKFSIGIHGRTVAKATRFGIDGPAGGNKCALYSGETNGSMSHLHIWL